MKAGFGGETNGVREKPRCLKCFTGSVEASAGKVSPANNLRIVYFDQLRSQLDPELTLRESLCPLGDMVMYQSRQVHITSYAAKFLFGHDQLAMPLKSLSGGEQAKALIAMLMLQPADVLILDEPTNDLDLSTLQVLEQSLNQFEGALVMVTHDRALLDSVCSVVLGFTGQSNHALYADYHQWALELKQRQRSETKVAKEARPKRVKQRSPLSYLEKKELAVMEKSIQAVEEKIEHATGQLSDPAIASDAYKLGECYERLEELKAKGDSLYQRWEFLEQKLNGELDEA